MYQGEVVVAKEDLDIFLAVAKNLNVKGLCETNTEHFNLNQEEGGDTCSEKNCSQNSYSEKQNFDPSLILLRKKISEQYQ